VATDARKLPAQDDQRQTQRGSSARFRVGILCMAGLCAGVLAAVLGPWQPAPLIGWDVAAAGYVGWEWATVGRLDARRTARQAVREDPSRPGTDALLLLASVASLLAVGLVIVTASKGTSVPSPVQIGLCVISVVCSWSVVHTVYTLRYARLYYTGSDGGVDFNQPEPPRFTDFAYLAFTIGMTFQVSDTDLTTSSFRATALRHALLSYLFGAVILASTINLVAGLLK
jgi:uncharacterized membrane protein